MAGFVSLENNQRYRHKRFEKIVHRAGKRKKIINADLENKLYESDIKLLELLKRQERTLIVRKSDDKILALTRMKGVVLNSILAMNIKPSKFIVKINAGSELEGGELRCNGISFEKRIPAHCDLLVYEEREFVVDIDLWDLDGAEGIIADYYYAGAEKTFLTSSLATFFAGVLDVSKERIATPYGEMTKANAKNAVLGGLMGIAGNAKNKIVESGEQKITISYVNSGKEVIIFFNQGISLEK